MELINRLKEFYMLEVLQVGFYESQLSSMKENEYVYHVYKLLVKTEKSHVEYFADEIEKYGGKIPVISVGLAALAGDVLGETMDLTSAGNRYELGKRMEDKAIKMYRGLVMDTMAEPDLNDMMWQFMIDEELHLLWFKDNQKHAASLILE